MSSEQPSISDEMRQLVTDFMQAVVDQDDARQAELFAAIQEKRKTEPIQS